MAKSPKFTEWEREILHQLLSNANVGKAPLGMIADLIKAREALKEDNATLTPDQLAIVAEIANNPALRFPIDERSLALMEKLS